MIRLNLAFAGEHGSSDQAPYVVRLQEGVPDGEDTARLWFDGEDCYITSARGTLRIADAVTAGVSVGEIVAIFPQARRLDRMFRPGANANTLLLTEECDQRCVVCSQPPRPFRHDHYDLYDRLVDLLPAGEIIGLSGGEPLLLADRLFPWLRQASERRPDIGFHLLSNAQGITAAHRSDLRALRHAVLWGVPLYSADSDIHDRFVGKAGAQRRLLDGLDLLAAAGAAVELRTVVAAPLWGGFPRLASFIGRHLGWIRVWAVMQLEHRGYAKYNWGQMFVDTSGGIAPLQMAVTLADAAGVGVRLYNFPLCTLPEILRKRAVASISDWKRFYPEGCDGCPLRVDCGGFFEWHRFDHSYLKGFPSWV